MWCSNIYYINDRLDKRTWTYIFGACCATTVFIPSFHNYRIWSFLGLAMTTYTAWYLTIAAFLHGQVCHHEIGFQFDVKANNCGFIKTVLSLLLWFNRLREWHILVRPNLCCTLPEPPTFSIHLVDTLWLCKSFIFISVFQYIVYFATIKEQKNIQVDGIATVNSIIHFWLSNLSWNLFCISNICFAEST